MDWKRLDSSNLDAMRYDPETKQLQVRFKSGRTYDYPEVPQDVADGLESAGSPGAYFNTAIKGVYG